jgi:hypothetical protein
LSKVKTAHILDDSLLCYSLQESHCWQFFRNGAHACLQRTSDLIASLDNLQFIDCQRRKKWHKRLEEEKNPEIRQEITRRLLDNEDKTYQTILEMVRLLKETKSVVEGADTTLKSNRVETQLDDIIAKL